MIIYKIKNKINGKQYIGQTVWSLQKRWGQHCYERENCKYLNRAIKKYGKNNFEVKVIVRCNTMEEMNHREEYYIRLFHCLAPNGYNIRSGGKSGGSLSLDTKKKLSLARLGSKQTLETIQKRVIKNQKSITCSNGKTYNSIKEAAEKLNLIASNISRVLKGKAKRVSGYKFMYKNEEK